MCNCVYGDTYTVYIQYTVYIYIQYIYIYIRFLYIYIYLWELFYFRNSGHKLVVHPVNTQNCLRSGNQLTPSTKWLSMVFPFIIPPGFRSAFNLRIRIKKAAGSRFRKAAGSGSAKNECGSTALVFFLLSFMICDC